MTEEQQKIRTFRDLRIWQKSIKPVSQIYKITQSFPKEEAFGLTSHMCRSSVSIPSNIEEGQGRNSTKNFAFSTNCNRLTLQIANSTCNYKKFIIFF